MSIKFTTLVASLLLFLSFHSNLVRADYMPPSIAAEDDIEAAEAKVAMAPLLDLDQMKPLVLSEKEESPSKKLSDAVFQERVEGTLANQDIRQKIADFIVLPSVSNTLVEEYDTLMLANKINFSPTTEEGLKERQMLKEKSWTEKVEKALDKIGTSNSYFEGAFLNGYFETE